MNKPIILYRSARTGRFVTKTYARRHPATTVKERMKRMKRKRDVPMRYFVEPIS